VPIIDCNTLFGFWPREKVDLSVDTLLGAMRARSVARSVTCSAKAILYDTGEGNDDTAVVCGGKTELIPAAVLDPRQYPVCLEEARKRLGQGVRVFRLYPDRHGYPTDFAPLEELLPLLGDALVMVSASWVGAATSLVRWTSRFPGRLVLTDLSPMALGEALAALKSSDRVYLETSGPGLESAGALEIAVRTLGPDRILFGSGAPLISLGSALTALEYADLSDAERAAIQGDNLAKLLTPGS
jgi:predicted TIM-barrel fold metal-dependent hydrolase